MLGHTYAHTLRIDKVDRVPRPLPARRVGLDLSPRPPMDVEFGARLRLAPLESLAAQQRALAGSGRVPAAPRACAPRNAGPTRCARRRHSTDRSPSPCGSPGVVPATGSLRWCVRSGSGPRPAPACPRRRIVCRSTAAWRVGSPRARAYRCAGIVCGPRCRHHRGTRPARLPARPRRSASGCGRSAHRQSGSPRRAAPVRRSGAAAPQRRAPRVVEAEFGTLRAQDRTCMRIEQRLVVPDPPGQIRRRKTDHRRVPLRVCKDIQRRLGRLRACGAPVHPRKNPSGTGRLPPLHRHSS